MLEPSRLEQHGLAFACSAGGGGHLVRVPGAQVVVNGQSDAGFCNFILLREADPSRLAATLELGSAILKGEGRQPLLFVGPLAIPEAGGDGGEEAPHVISRFQVLNSGGPVNRYAAIEAVLTELGWRPVARQVVLAAPLPPPPPNLNPAVAIRQVGQSDLTAWAELLTEAYQVSPLSAPGIAQGYTALFEQPGESAQARFYVGEWEPPSGDKGSPVGTGLSWQRGDLLGLYAGAVLPSARGHGVERASLWQRMQDGAATGAMWAYLQTEVDSPVVGLACRHLGFQPVYERSVWALPVEISPEMVDIL